ncbi:Hpt domain-containing protein [Paenarthrobacter sp. NPDC018779]|uniref:Hpt domain-containing protein n=1 Tax=Paenarthrobacter sp. NPDC018779 TaxID=3364375 RepID=UPI0037C6E7A5
MSALTSINKTADHDPGLAILNPVRLQSLADELESFAEAQRFLSAYLQMLPERVERIVDAVMDHDEERLTVALLSLGTASNMVGAFELEAICGGLKNLAATGSFIPIVLDLPVIRAAAARVRAAALWTGQCVRQESLESAPDSLLERT